MMADGLLRFTTAGSVDDGKSTLIGRLLHDSRSLFDDQLSAAEERGHSRGAAGVDLASFTDGLIAEREQGITIDVAYRYFATPVRKFIIADTPGHEQYTRNMATGASTAQLAIVLVDARHGVRPQSRRHALIAKLLGIPHVVVAVNKMDLVDYAPEPFDAIRREFAAFAAQLGIRDLHVIPMSALNGDMVVERGTRLSWYQGPALLQLLETIEPVPHAASQFRFPVQLVSRPQRPEMPIGRGYMGRIESGAVAVGDPVVALPSGLRTTVAAIVTADDTLERAHAPQSVTLLLADEIDISRGDLLAHPDGTPRIADTIDATLCWMDETPLDPRRKYLVKHTTRTVTALFRTPFERMDIATLDHHRTDTLQLNDIGRVRIRLQQPLLADPYGTNRVTGSFIVIDPASNNTIAAGMIECFPQD
ncbi:MAG TPA: GTP-binding protein [Burkholderiales bacterium]|nr:GTP-binding protein [Burkholderiales bacterium]